LTLSLNVSQLYDGEGHKIGLLISFEDMTEIKTLQEMMRRADRLAALGTVAAGLAHEIRNPLSTVKTFVQLVPQKAHTSSFLDKFSNLVPKELNRINNILENFLDLARKPKLKFAPLDINEIIEELADLYRTKIEHEGTSIAVSLHHEALTISGDYEYLKRAFSNLILNALQAMTQGGTLLIETAPLTFNTNEESIIGVERAIKVIFKDTGMGMDSETSKNIFNPFYSTKDKGTGLGLVIVQKIIEEHKGMIEVKSELRIGTTFTVILPAILELQYTR
jgi:signal transduction histidine kinase